MTYAVLSGICLVLLLLCSAITDIRKRTIPLKPCLLFSLFIITLQLSFSNSLIFLLSHVLAGSLLFILFLVNALFFQGGGGDCILAFCVGLALGLPAGLRITIVACTAMVLYHFLIAHKQKHCPMAPAMLLAAVIYFILSGGFQ